jgi:protein gp37
MRYFFEICPILDNLCLGVTVCNQAEADEKIPVLLGIPAEVRFVSIEPMLTWINLEPTGALGCDCKDDQHCFGTCNFYRHSFDKRKIDWVICGGETGTHARPMNPDCARSIRDQCKKSGVPFFFKQMSNREPIPQDLMVREFPKQKKGGTHDEN